MSSLKLGRRGVKCVRSVELQQRVKEVVEECRPGLRRLMPASEQEITLAGTKVREKRQSLGVI